MDNVTSEKDKRKFIWSEDEIEESRSRQRNRTRTPTDGSPQIRKSIVCSRKVTMEGSNQGENGSVRVEVARRNKVRVGSRT